MSDQHNQYCFCELAPLYALGSLDETEKQWVENRIQECPELAEEIADYQAAVAVIPYGVTLQPLSADLKERVFLHAIGKDYPEEDYPESASRVSTPFPEVGNSIKASELKWRPFNAPGFQMARLHLDREKRELSCLVRAEAGLPYPAHRHAGPEEILMLEGELRIGNKIYGPGDYIHTEANSIHPNAESATACMFFLKTSIDNEILS